MKKPIDVADFPYLPRSEQRLQVSQMQSRIEELEQGMWDIATMCGFDTDGETTPRSLAYPDVIELAKEQVRELRDDYDAALDELPPMQRPS